MELTGKRALITGAGSGIGRACAIRLAEAGASVAVVDLRAESAAETVTAIQGAGGNALGLRFDVTRRAEVLDAFQRVQEAWGGLDILLNNAGGSLTSRFLDLSEDEWDHV